MSNFDLFLYFFQRWKKDDDEAEEDDEEEPRCAGLRQGEGGKVEQPAEGGHMHDLLQP